ncbi:MAG: hypothetical protein GY752_00840 [bacterium]|nr:hypothetical protein [bacterium]
MKIIVLSTLLLILSISAIGQTEPDPNSLGIYFDEGAIENVLYATAPTTVHAYLIATRISSTYGIEAWGCRVMTYGVPIYSTIRGDGVNTYNNVTSNVQQFDVTYPMPLPYSTAIVLADIYIPISDEQPIGLCVDYLYGSGITDMYYVSLGEIISLRPPVNCSMPPCLPSWVASINYNGPVANEEKSWGEIKTLFR